LIVENMNDPLHREISQRFLRTFNAQERATMFWHFEDPTLPENIFADKLIRLRNFVDGNPNHLNYFNRQMLAFYIPEHRDMVLERILPLFEWGLGRICPQYGPDPLTGRSQIAVTVQSRDPLSVWVAVGPYRTELLEVMRGDHIALQHTIFYLQSSRENEIGTDLGLALSSLRLRLDSLESTVGGRDIPLSARAPPARDSAFSMVRRRQAGDFRGSGTDHLMPEYALSIKEDKVKLFEFMVLYALPAGKLEKHMVTGRHTVFFSRIWEGLCEMGYAGRMWVTKSILSYWLVNQTLDRAYLEYKKRDMRVAEENMCQVLRSFFICMVIHEVFGRNLDVVKAALTIRDPGYNSSPLIVSAFGWPDVSNTFMTIFLNSCLKYETETTSYRKMIYADDVQSYFKSAMGITLTTSVDAWAAGVLRAPT
jgi:hypothetical protein